MNVRMEQQSLRFKINETELESLLKGNLIEEKLNIVDTKLTIIIDPNNDENTMLPSMYASTDNISLHLAISQDKLYELKNMGKNREGIKTKYKELQTSLQLDFRKNKEV